MHTRLGLGLGMTLATAIAVWWLAASRIAILGGADTALLAARALFLLAVLRAMLVAVLAPRVASTGGYAAGVRVAIPLVTAAWPVVGLAWAAGMDSVARTALVEAALVGGALVTPAVGHVLARKLAGRAWTEPVATAVGIALACGICLFANHWRPFAV